jgi:hypothetical protein
LKAVKPSPELVRLSCPPGCHGPGARGEWRGIVAAGPAREFWGIGVAKKKRSRVQATAKAEAVAKLEYTRKKVTTEVIPPDVTRAKNASWLDLISPITEWAGLKGDALRYRRQQLRIQQEETLLRLADEVRRKMAGQEVLQPVSHKILVPTLEKASLENPSDDVMIERWANLLASAAQKVPVQPRFVGILGELTGSQAKCLEYIAFNHYEDYKYPYKEFVENDLLFNESVRISEAVTVVHDAIGAVNNLEEIVESVGSFFERPGVFVDAIFCDGHPYSFGDRPCQEQDLLILESLGLIEKETFEMPFGCNKMQSGPVELQVIYYHLTRLGVAFCEVCSRPRVLELERISERERELQRQGEEREGEGGPPG